MLALSFAALLLFFRCSSEVVYGAISPFTSPVEVRTTNREDVLQKTASLFDLALRNVSEPDGAYKSTCFKDMNTVHSALHSSTPEMWAITMLDSFGKPSSGLVKGSIQWSGSFSQCRSVVYEKEGHGFRGKYCWAHFALDPKFVQTMMPGSETMKIVVKSGVCVPDSCFEEELLLQGKELTGTVPWINKYAKLTEIRCVVDLNIWDHPWDIFFLMLTCTIVFFICVATISDLWTHGNKERKPSILHAISAYSNGKKLFKLKGSSQGISTLNGLRVLSMVLIVLAHATLSSFSTIDNIKYFIDQFPGKYFTLLRQGFLAVDTFFFISGLLVSYMYLKEYQRSLGRIPWSSFYFHRIWRLTVPYLFNLAISTVLASRYVSQGPFWSHATDNTAICRDYWWTNVLYINNFMPFYKQCMGQMWYVACDMQFYILSPLLLIPFSKWSVRRSVIIVALVIVGSCSISAYVGSSLDADISADFGETFPGSERYIDVFDDFYIKPYTRITPYIVGMATGWFLHKNKMLRIPKIWVVVGWALTLTLGATLYEVISLPIRKNFIFKCFHHGLAKLTWSLCLVWIVTSSVFGYGGIIGRFLSLEIWDLLARLSYGAYLCHEVWEAILFLSTDVTTHYETTSSVLVNITAVVSVFAGSVVVTLLFESPFTGLQSYLMPRKKSKTQMMQEHHRTT